MQFNVSKASYSTVGTTLLLVGLVWLGSNGLLEISWGNSFPPAITILLGLLLRIISSNKNTDVIADKEENNSWVLNTIPCPILILDNESKITFANTAMEDYLNYSSDYLRGLSFTELLADDELITLTGLEPMLAKGPIRHLTIALQNSSGERFVSQLNSQTIDGDTSSSPRLLLFFYDLEEYQEALALESRATVVQANRAYEIEVTTKKKLETVKNVMEHTEKLSTLGEMVSTIGHEISNAIWLVGSATKELQQETNTLETLVLSLFDDSPEARQVKQAMEKQFETQKELLTNSSLGCQRLTDISRALRNSARMDDRPVEGVPVNSIIEESILMTKGKTQRLKLTKELGDIPSIICHPSKIGQVITNLISNGVDAALEKNKSTPKNESQKQSRIHVCSKPELQDGRRGISIQIADTGGGVPEELREKIFEEFFTTKPPGQGTGIGLWMCSLIVGDHGGTITVSEDETLPGACFKVWLPIDGGPEKTVSL